MIAVMLLLCVVLATVYAEGMLSLEFSGKRNALQSGDCANSNPCSSQQTCCDTSAGEGCCPQANACCCPDQQHCCPNGKCQCSGCPGANCSCVDCTLNGGQCE